MSEQNNGLQIKISGESHSEKIELTLTGMPVGEAVDLDLLQKYIHRRTLHGDGLTLRNESDILHIASGMKNGIITGEISAYVDNNDRKSEDYEPLRNLPRPSHADYPAMIKDGTDLISGGGRFSGRLTVMTVAAGGIAAQILNKHGIFSAAHLLSAGEICDTPFDTLDPQTELLQALSGRAFPVIDQNVLQKMKDEILHTANAGVSIGGTVEYKAVGLPVGLGDNLCGGLESVISSAVFGVPAIKGIEFGDGFALAKMRGSTANDQFTIKDGKIATLQNRSGGITGGMSNGMPLIFKAAVKPTPSIALPQQTVNIKTLKEEKITVGGRHDACIAPRAAIAVEAAANTAILDLMIKEGRI
ncbi:MAG: chorismate synthase [Oscillospiraceae bacterium]|nr:chorismate synthase [Candidatus Equicaccousia limihippi]